MLPSPTTLRTTSDLRPRLAIVGGGGAMGRLFAQLFCDSAREIYLLDYFGHGNRSANLALTVEDMCKGGEKGGLVPRVYYFRSVGAADTNADLPGWTLTTAEPLSHQALVVLARKPDDPDDLSADPTPRPLIELVDRAAAVHSDGCVIFGGRPENAPAFLPRADITLLAIGYESAETYTQAILPYLSWVATDSLVVDLGSSQTGPLDVLARHVAPGVGLLGAHPLFGPSVTDVTGLIVAVVEATDGRATSPWRDWFLDRLTRLRLIVTSTTAAKHDDAMAFVQSLTHFALLSFAYTFVRADRDPADLLIYRTPVFEPLMYLAARVAHLARSNPDTYRSIQTLTARPDVRREFLAAAGELLSAIESATADGGRASASEPDELSTLFSRYGAPWSPDGHNRRDRQRREHFLEMGVHLVDDLNELRHDVIASAGQVRAVEERHTGHAPRVVVGVIDLDLLDPGKYDLTTQIRLRRLNLALGSLHGSRTGRRSSNDDGQDEIVPLARARILTDREMLAWLYRTGQLVERRAYRLVVPRWFDREIVLRLVKGLTDGPRDVGSQVWDVDVMPEAIGPHLDAGQKIALVTLAIVIHPAELVEARATCQNDSERRYAADRERLDRELAETRESIARSAFAAESPDLRRRKSELKHRRKALLDRRTTEIDREVRRVARDRVQRIAEIGIEWLRTHGCSLATWEPDDTGRPDGLGRDLENPGVGPTDAVR